jgi:hypothetical protein
MAITKKDLPLLLAITGLLLGVASGAIQQWATMRERIAILEATQQYMWGDLRDVPRK